MTEFNERLLRNMAKHKPVLDRLARAGDCRACVVAQVNGHEGCGAHAPRSFTWVRPTDVTEVES